jgi:hypothetical protein
MSDQWIFFPCQIGDRPGSIFYDQGISETLDEVAPRELLKVRAVFKQPRPDGLSSNEEYPALAALEDDLSTLTQQHQCLYVGRITVGGHRQFHIYTPDTDAKRWGQELESLGRRHGYLLTFDLRHDEEHEGYWNELFPNDDDWQVIEDLRLLDALKQQGDDGTASRQIDHWAFFSSQAATEEFSRWLDQQGYVGTVTEVADGGRFRVSFSHTGTVQLSEITSHSISLRRKASDLGGEYDGWETLVCAGED